MKAFFVNTTARTVTAFDFSGKNTDLADILHTTPAALRGAGLTEGKTPDVMFVAYEPSENEPFFLVSGLPVPLKGNAVLVGMAETMTDVDGTGASGGEARPAPTTTLEWLKGNILWLGQPQDFDGTTGFQPDIHNSPEAVINVLASLADMPGQLKVEMPGMDRMPARPIHTRH